jgi:hypothetical protein
MDFRFVPPDLKKIDHASGEVIACAIWEDLRPLTGLAGLLDWRLVGLLSKLARGGAREEAPERPAFLGGALGEVLFVPGKPRLPFDKVLVVGLGPRAAFGDDAFRTALRRLVTTLDGLHVRRAVVELPGRGDDAIAPERAAELVLEQVAARSDQDAWVLVEPLEAQKRIAKRAQERRRSMPPPADSDTRQVPHAGSRREA